MPFLSSKNVYSVGIFELKSFVLLQPEHSTALSKKIITTAHLNGLLLRCSIVANIQATAAFAWFIYLTRKAFVKHKENKHIHVAEATTHIARHNKRQPCLQHFVLAFACVAIVYFKKRNFECHWQQKISWHGHKCYYNRWGPLLYVCHIQINFIPSPHVQSLLRHVHCCLSININSPEHCWGCIQLWCSSACHGVTIEVAKNWIERLSFNTIPHNVVIDGCIRNEFKEHKHADAKFIDASDFPSLTLWQNDPLHSAHFIFFPSTIGSCITSFISQLS